MLFNVKKYNIADDEIEKVILYYETISNSLGKKAETEILATLAKLSNHANHYLFLPDKIHRRIQVHGFPYMFVYTIETNNVIVKILFPQKEDPAKLWERLIV